MKNNIHHHVTIFYTLCVISGLSLTLSGCKEDMKDVYQKAMKAYQDEDYHTAAKLFERILQDYPDHSLSQKARYELGKMYLYKLKQPQAALKHLQNLYGQSQPGTYSLEALKLIGSIYEASLNDCLKGVEAYKILLEQYASDIDGGEYQFAIGECYFKLNDYEQAMLEYTTFVESYPENQNILKARFQIANSYALQENWEQAITLHEELLASENLSPQLAANIKWELAFCYEQQEEFEGALQLYQELKTIHSEEVVLDTALLERKIERVEEAFKESQKNPGEVDWKRK